MPRQSTFRQAPTLRNARELTDEIDTGTSATRNQRFASSFVWANYPAVVAQNLRLLDAWVTAEGWPYVACPYCADGHLAIEKITTVESEKSSRSRGHPDWDPTWIEGVFHGTLKCALPNCGEHVTVAGEYAVDVDTDEAGYGTFAEFLRLRYCQPPLQVAVLPDGTPDEVKAAVVAASAVLWVDPGAAANRLRFAIEELLTARGIRRYETRGGSRFRLSTHKRIQEFKKKAPVAGDALEAVKWIGNSGSHDDELTTTDVLNGVDLLRHALRVMYDKEDLLVQKRIKAINKARGIPKSRKSKSK